MTMPSRPRRPLPTFRVRIDAHDVPPRWRIEAHTVELTAPDADAAALRVVRWAQADAGVPPWWPCVRHSLTFTTAKAPPTAEDQTVHATPLVPQQLPLWTDRIAA
jgi:hypothetical protein